MVIDKCGNQNYEGSYYCLRQQKRQYDEVINIADAMLFSWERFRAMAFLSINHQITPSLGMRLNAHQLTDCFGFVINIMFMYIAKLRKAPASLLYAHFNDLEFCLASRLVHSQAFVQGLEIMNASEATMFFSIHN